MAAWAHQILRGAGKRLLRRRTWQRLAGWSGREIAPRRWIFLLGCYNSGTTLLKDILAQHPEISTLPGEGVKLTDALGRPEHLGWQRMWCRCLPQVRLEPGPEGAARAARIKRQWSFFYSPSRSFFLEKSIVHAANIPFLMTYFQPASFIYLVRNGYAVAEGIRRKSRPLEHGNRQFGARYPIALCAEQWRVSDEMVRRDRVGLTSFLQLSYEELVADAAGVLERITDFLALEPLEESTLTRRWRVHGVEAGIQNMNPQSIGRLSQEEIHKVETEAGAALRAYGYAAV